MFDFILSYILGTYICRVKEEHVLACVNLLRDNTVSVRKAHSDGGDYVFTVLAPQKNRICSILDSCGISYSLSKLRGFPNGLTFLLRRPGIALGIVLFFIMAFFSSRTVWGFDVVGNLHIPDDEILLMLDDLGCGFGAYIPSLDLDDIHAKFLALNPDVSWISVNFKGNFATVEVIETRKAEPAVHPEGTYANLVAAEDGQILLVKTESGKSSAEVGQIVKKGDILVSGVIDVREDRVRYEYAEGEVLAYVPRKIEVIIPFERPKKVYTGRKKEYKSVKIFKKSINLFTKGGIEYAVYDKIIDERQVKLFGKFPLPVWTTETTAREYEYVMREHTLEESAAFAKMTLRQELDEILANAELVSNKVNYEVTDDAFVIRYDMLCLADIAEVKEFKIIP